jgi:hypothetical protein
MLDWVDMMQSYGRRRALGHVVSLRMPPKGVNTDREPVIPSFENWTRIHLLLAADFARGLALNRKRRWDSLEIWLDSDIIQARVLSSKNLMIEQWPPLRFHVRIAMRS